MAAKKYGKSVTLGYKGLTRADVGDPSALTARVNSTAVALGDYRRPATPNGWAYKCVKAGTTAGSEPTMPTSVDETVADGTAIWQAYSKGVVAVLVTSSYTPDQDTHDFLDDVVANEATGTGYARKYCSTANGLTTITYTAGTNKTNMDFADLVWTTITSSFRHIVFACDLGTDAKSPLLSWDDLGAQSPSGVNFTYEVNAAGILEHTTS